jgi:hypothetical protein
MSWFYGKRSRQEQQLEQEDNQWQEDKEEVNSGKRSMRRLTARGARELEKQVENDSKRSSSWSRKKVRARKQQEQEESKGKMNKRSSRRNR